MRIVEWPDWFKLSEVSFSLNIPKIGTRSVFSGQDFNRVIGPPSWTMRAQTVNIRHEQLPRHEAFLRRLRQGLNLVRVGDKRLTGRLNVLSGTDFGETGQQPANLLPNSGAIANWSRIGPEGVAISHGVQARYTSDYYARAVADFGAGIDYVLAVDVRSSHANAQISLNLDAGVFGEPIAAVYNASTGALDTVSGAVLGTGTSDIGDGWSRVLVAAKALQRSRGYAHVYPMLASAGNEQLELRNPQVTLYVEGVPPTYVPSGPGGAWTGIAPYVNGAGQTGDELETAGWPPGVTLKAGHWIAYGDGMHQLLDDVTANSSGGATLWIEPPIRVSPADGQLITWRGVVGLFYLTSVEAAYTQRNVVVPSIELVFNEFLGSPPQ